jgi:hypothetical protein
MSTVKYNSVGQRCSKKGEQIDLSYTLYVIALALVILSVVVKLEKATQLINKRRSHAHKRFEGVH